MSDTPEKRRREAKKRRKREMKAHRKQMRQDGALGHDNTGLFPPGDRPREVVTGFGAVKPPPPPPEPEPAAEGEGELQEGVDATAGAKTGKDSPPSEAKA